MKAITRPTPRHAGRLRLRSQYGIGDHRRYRAPRTVPPGIYVVARATGSPRREAARISYRIHLGRLGWALRHPVIWHGDRHLRRAFKRAGAV